MFSLWFSVLRNVACTMHLHGTDLFSVTENKTKNVLKKTKKVLKKRVV